jgi:predicted O-methyltransferase YrrM
MDIVARDVRDYMLQMYRPAHPVLLPLRESGERNLVPIIMRDTESVLAMLLRMNRPRKILEIGTAIGYSAMFFALELPEAQVYTVELDEITRNTACHNIRAAGLADRIHSLLGDGQAQIDRLREEGECGFDFVFIDAAKSHYRRFLESALTVTADRALIVSDNILIHGMTVSEAEDPRRKHLTNVRKMREYLDYVTNDPRLKTTLLPVGDGLAITEFNRYG